MTEVRCELPRLLGSTEFSVHWKGKKCQIKVVLDIPLRMSQNIYKDILVEGKDY